MTAIDALTNYRSKVVAVPEESRNFQSLRVGQISEDVRGSVFARTPNNLSINRKKKSLGGYISPEISVNSPNMLSVPQNLIKFLDTDLSGVTSGI